MKDDVTPSIHKNDIYNNEFLGIAIGDDNISSDDTPNPTIYNNTIYGNGGTHKGNDCPDSIRGYYGEQEPKTPIYGDCGAGIGIRAKATGYIYGNTIYNHIGTNQNGIELRQSAHPIIGKDKSGTASANIIKNNYRGIGIRHNTYPTVSNNEIYSNIWMGIGIQDDTSPTIDNNKIYSNTRMGIGVKDTAAPIIEANEIYRNGGTDCTDEPPDDCDGGIGNKDSSSAQIKGNRIYGHMGVNNFGIGIKGTASPTISNNNLIYSNYRGIGVKTTDAVTPVIKNNEIYNNQRHGIGNRGQSKAYIYDNTIRNNGLDTMDDVNHAGEILPEETAGGVMVREQAYPTIENNRIFSNPAGGIACREYNPDKTKPVTIKGNQIYENGWTGLRMKEGAYVLLTGKNKIYNHTRQIYDNPNNNAGAIRIKGEHAVLTDTLLDQTGMANNQVYLGAAADTPSDCGGTCPDDYYSEMTLITAGSSDPKRMVIYDYEQASKIAYVYYGYAMKGYEVQPTLADGDYSITVPTKLVMRDGNEIYNNKGKDPDGKAEPAAIQLRDGAMLEMDGSPNPNRIYDNLYRGLGGSNNVRINIHNGNRIYNNPEYGLAVSNRYGSADSHSYLTVEDTYINSNCIGGTETFRQGIGISPLKENSKLTIVFRNNKVYNNRDGGGIGIASLQGSGGEGAGYVDGIIENNEVYGNRTGNGIFLGENAGVLIIKNQVYGNKYGVNIWDELSTGIIEERNWDLPLQTDGQGDELPNNQVKLDSGASTQDDYYNGMTLAISAAEPRWVNIYDYDGDNKIVYVSPVYSLRPVAGAEYIIADDRYIPRVGDGTDAGRNFIHDNLSGGMSIYNSATIIDKNEIYNNGSVQATQADVSSDSGSGIVTQYSPNLRIRNNIIHNNVDSGIKARHGANLTIENNKIYSNGLFGIACDGSSTGRVTLVIENNEIYSNGQLYELGAGIAAQEYADLTIKGNDIYGNGDVTSGTGNGVQFQNYVDVTLKQNKIHHNVENGIAVAVVDHTAIDKVRLINNFIYKNKYGISIADAPAGNLEVHNNTVVSNTSYGMRSSALTVRRVGGPSTGNYWYVPDGSALCDAGVVKNTILWGNNSTNEDEYCQTLATCVPLGVQEGIIQCSGIDGEDRRGFCMAPSMGTASTCQASGFSNTDPAFVDAANDNYHLSATSPALNSGINSGVEVDYDGDIRADTYDEGADEYAVSLSKITLADKDGTGDPLSGYTNELTIDVTITGFGATQMILSENSDFSGASWTTYNSSTTFTLSSCAPSESYCSKTVYCRLQNASAVQSTIKNSSIILDENAPEVDSEALIKPDSSALWNIRTSQEVRWDIAKITDSNLKDRPIELGYSTDGMTYNEIDSQEANDGIYYWTPPIIDKTTTTIKLGAYDIPDRVAYWDFNEGSGTVANDSEGSGSLTLSHMSSVGSSGTSWLGAGLGKSGNAVNFDGSGSLIAAANTAEDINFGTGTFTIEAWIKPTALTSDKVYGILSKGVFNNDYRLGITTYTGTEDGSRYLLTFGLSDRLIDCNGEGEWVDTTMDRQALVSDYLLVDEWAHVVGIRNGSTVKIYHNGALVMSAEASYECPNTGEQWLADIDLYELVFKPAYIGKIDTDDIDVLPFKGAIDEVAVYSRELTADEVMIRYAGFEGVAPGRPNNSSPANAAAGVSLTPTLSVPSGDYNDANGDTHQASRWRVRLASGNCL